MSVATRLRSRRMPPLRVVSCDHRHVRHAAMISGASGPDMLAEVITFAEMDALADSELVGTHRRHLLPGLGYLIIRKPNGVNEVADVEDVQWQARQEIESAYE